MLHKNARYACALALVLALSPLAAFADTGRSSEDGYVVAHVIEAMDETASALYTDSLTPPVDVITSTTVMPSAGILRGSDGVIYYLRETPVSGGTGYSYSTLEGYSISDAAWSTLAALPQRLTYCSADMWNGRLIVCGVASGATQESMYMYNPANDSWSTLNSEGVPLGASIVYDGTGLFLVGGNFGEVGFGTTVYSYSVDEGLGDIVANLGTKVLNPQLAAHNESIYVYSYGDTVADWTAESATVAQYLQVISDGVSTDLSASLPTFKASVATANVRAQMYGSLAAAIEGLVIVGPGDEADTADTYVMSWDGAGSFAPYSRRVSTDQLYGTAACIYSNKLYAAGSSLVESGHQAFRATTVEACAVQSGNYAVWRKGSTAQLPVVFSPDISRFASEITVDGTQLERDKDYVATTGSTRVELMVQFLQNLSVGQHEMVTYFDGGGVGVTTYFTVENEADSIASADGRTRPAALAMTGDAMLVVPFAVVGVGAIALAVYLLRRKSRTI